jgi:hypothetical protein
MLFKLTSGEDVEEPAKEETGMYEIPRELHMLDLISFFIMEQLFRPFVSSIVVCIVYQF